MNHKLLSMLMSGAVFLAAGAVAAQDLTGGVTEKAAKPAGKPAITVEQRSMLDEKLRLITSMVRAAGADLVGTNVTAEQQRWLLESLYQMPLAQIRAMRLSGSIEGITHEMTKAKAVMPKLEQPALGGLTSELVYLPVTPCRLIDTRNVGGPIVGSRAFDLDLNGSTFGGSASCNVVSNSGIGTSGNGAAVAINVAIVSPTAAPGFIGARPVGAANTTALVNWYQAGAAVQASNAGVISYDQQGAVADEIEFFGSPTQIIVDLFGVFAAPTATALQCSNTTNIATPVNAGASFSLNAGACPTGYTSVSVNCRTSAFNTVNYASVGANTGGADCQGTNISGGQITMNVSQLCCRIPGR